MEHKLKIRTGWNKPHTKGKAFTLPSLTVPDLSMDMRSLMERVSSGIGVNGMSPIWEAPVFEELGRDIRTLDLVQQQELREYYKAKAAEKRQELYEQNQRAKELKREKLAKQAADMFNQFKTDILGQSGYLNETKTDKADKGGKNPH